MPRPAGLPPGGVLPRPASARAMSDRLGEGGWPLDRPPRAGKLVSLVPRDFPPLNDSLARRDPLRRVGTCCLTVGLPAVSLGTSPDLGTSGALPLA